MDSHTRKYEGVEVSKEYMEEFDIRFRVGSHDLPIETGKWCQKRREERLCETCGVLGDELHYVYGCSLIPRDDMMLEDDIGRIWTQPDVFNVFKRLNSIDLL